MSTEKLRVYHSDGVRDFFVTMTRTQARVIEKTKQGKLVRYYIDRYLAGYRKAKSLTDTFHQIQPMVISLKGILAMYARDVERGFVWDGDKFVNLLEGRVDEEGNIRGSDHSEPV
jgi:hypothetical protein